MSRALLIRASCLLAVLATGCGGAAGDEEDLGATEQAIKDGYVDEGDPAVVGIYDQVEQALCSGSLIAPNVVLTARHCVSPVLHDENGVDCGKTAFGPLNPPGNFLVTTQFDMTATGWSGHGVREVIGLDSTGLCGEDQAILILDVNVDAAEAIPLVPRVDVPLAAGEPYWAVGFGATDEAGSGSGVRRRRDGLVVSCVGESCGQATVKGTEWRGDQGICHGDSGGPALDMQGRVIGITSRGGLECTSPVYGYALGHADWIKAVTLHGAEIGGYAPPTWASGWPTDPAYSAELPLGDACSAAEECASGQCMIDADVTYCTRLCDAASPCPDGYGCDEGGSNVCVWQPPATKTKKKHHEPAASGCSVSASDAPASAAWLLGALAAVLFGRRRTETRRSHGRPSRHPARVAHVTLPGAKSL